MKSMVCIMGVVAITNPHFTLRYLSIWHLAMFGNLKSDTVRGLVEITNIRNLLMIEAAVLEQTGGNYVMQSGKYIGQMIKQILNSDAGYLPIFLIKAKNKEDRAAVEKVLEGNPQNAAKVKAAVAAADVQTEDRDATTEPDVPANEDKGYKDPNKLRDGWYMLIAASILVQARKMTDENKKDVNPKTKEPVFGKCPDIEIGMWCLIMPLGHKEALSEETFKTSYTYTRPFDGFK